MQDCIVRIMAGGSVPNVVEKGIGISYPIGKPNKDKGRYADGERISKWTGIDHFRARLSLEEVASQPLQLFAREGAKLLLTVALEEEVTTISSSGLMSAARVGSAAIAIVTRFPESQWKHICTSNVIERAFNKVKRRTRVVGHLSNETSALVMVFSLLEEERMR